MTKSELAKDLAKAERIPQTKAVSIIENVMDLIICHFQNGGEKITLRGFGTFKRRQRKAHTGTDPHSGQPLQIKEKNSITFKPAAESLRRIN